mmetsp:Transcript_10288/g.20135  ORF Transcript_10288/g.20135 Transcript_10288/m.20135 type:complete len:247 (-) Transcript_10288:413-1153(-)
MMQATVSPTIPASMCSSTPSLPLASNARLVASYAPKNNDAIGAEPTTAAPSPLYTPVNPPAARNPWADCNLVLIVSKGNRMVSTHTPATAPANRASGVLGVMLWDAQVSLFECFASSERDSASVCVLSTRETCSDPNPIFPNKLRDKSYAEKNSNPPKKHSCTLGINPENKPRTPCVLKIWINVFMAPSSCFASPIICLVFNTSIGVVIAAATAPAMEPQSPDSHAFNLRLYLKLSRRLRSSHIVN